MKKILIFFGVLILVLTSISIAFYLISRESVEQNVEPQSPNPTDEYQKSKLDTTIKNIYLGVLPCSDCSGIETIIVLSRENENSTEGTFIITESFMGTDKDPEEIRGTWTKRENSDKTASGSGIFVLTSDEGEQTQYEEIDERSIILLDKNGNQMQGDNKNYTLTNL